MAVTKVTVSGQDGHGVQVNDIKVVGEQEAAIADITPAADGTTAGTAVNSILAVLRAHGLIAT